MFFLTLLNLKAWLKIFSLVLLNNSKLTMGVNMSLWLSSPSLKHVVFYTDSLAPILQNIVVSLKENTDISQKLV